jgi:phosphosulfolactate synthase
MAEMAWHPIIYNSREARTEKSRAVGITMVLDTGLGLRGTEDVMDFSSALIDHWKLGFGTSVFATRDKLQEKLALLRDHEVLTYPGGTLLEVALVKHHCRVYMKRAKELGFSAVEISDGTISMPRFRRKNIINCARDAGLIPITEVGKKDPKRQPTADQIGEEALEDLEWGAEWVIIEGRESGTGIGVFDKFGLVEQDQVDRIAELMGEKISRVVWEAPLKNQQAALIEKFSSNVNFGNISPQQVLAVEALRCGLRFETLHVVTDNLIRSGRWDPAEVEPPNGYTAKKP